MPVDMSFKGHGSIYRVVVITLDYHAAGPVERAARRLGRDFPGLTVSVHAAAAWAESPHKLQQAISDVENGDIILVSLLFLEEHVKAIEPALTARRGNCDAMVGIISDSVIVRTTLLGNLDMAAPTSSSMRFLKKLRGSTKPSTESGARKMRMLRRLPQILKFIPGKAQDLRTWFLMMQYWLAASDENVERMIRLLISRYARHDAWRGDTVALPEDYPNTGLYHPGLKERITVDPDRLPHPKSPVGTVGLVMMRSYVLSSDTAHYDAVIHALEARDLRVIPAFAGGLDARPAIDSFFRGESGPKIDALISLTGFSLVGGPAYNDNDAAISALQSLDIPYIAAHPLEFQTIEQWQLSPQGLGPIETTMLIAFPELDGATVPTVYAGRTESAANGTNAMQPAIERVERLADRAVKQVRLRRSVAKDRRLAIILFGFPPNAGATGTAAYLDVFASLLNTLRSLKEDGYDLDPPETVEALRDCVLGGNSRDYGQEANVVARISADEIVENTPWLDDIEAAWGAAPGRAQSDGRSVFVLGYEFGNVFVGVQPAFGYEGDPMRLLFERNFAPTHAFVQFYQWIRHTFRADAVLHFGMHGALEFMPGKQAGVSADCWPDRLIGDLPNIYLYAANNPSEATLAKRRAGAVTVSHLTPPLASAGLYKGLAELKDSLRRWRELPVDDSERLDLETLISEQAEAVDLGDIDPEALWLKLLETEDALIPDGLHIVGQPLSEEAKSEYLSLVADTDTDAFERVGDALQQDCEIPALLRALGGHFTAPVPGGDLIRNPNIVPTGRNIHAFDPFRMPTEHACREGRRQAQLLLDTHATLPHAIALVLWGSDNIKTDGGPIGQALALIGARPRFDSFGRLAGADLIPLEELGRPRIDVVVTLSGIFRDLLPLQTRLLADAALQAAQADEPEEQNFVRAHTLARMEQTGCDLEQAALRVFSNAEGSYGSNVNQLVDSSAFGDENELADAYQSRKCYAYGTDGKAQRKAELLKETLKTVEVAYQNLESVELGVTSVDHYFDTLGGISRAVKRARGEEAAVYVSDQTRGTGKIRTLSDQIALETRSRSLNPRFFEPLLNHGAEGVRQIEAHLTNTMGWSATAGAVEPWVYKRLSETYVLDDAMRDRLADLNPVASSRMANRLLEASDRAYWEPDDATLAALRNAADILEDRVEGVAAE